MSSSREKDMLENSRLVQKLRPVMLSVSDSVDRLREFLDDNFVRGNARAEERGQLRELEKELIDLGTKLTWFVNQWNLRPVSFPKS